MNEEPHTHPSIDTESEPNSSIAFYRASPETKPETIKGLDSFPDVEEPHQIEVLEEIGHGGQGRILKVRYGDRIKALKIYSHPLHGDILAQVESKIYDLTSDEGAEAVRIQDPQDGRGKIALLMEYIDTTNEDPAQRYVNLKDRIAQGELGPEEVAHLIKDMANEIDLLAAHGIYSRDRKPENTLIKPGGKARNIDFAISNRAIEATGSKTTNQLEFDGTLQYISPERILEGTDGNTVQSELYSLGAIAYEGLTGTPLHSPPDDLGGLMPYLSALSATDGLSEEQKQTLTDKGYSIFLIGELDKALKKDPQQRHESARDFAEAIVSHLELHAKTGRSRD